MKYEDRELFIDCDNVKIHGKLTFPAQQKDKMPILVLIPGFTGHIEEDHIKALAQTANETGYVCLRTELYGHGKSEGKFFDHTVLIWMNEAMRVIDYARKLEFVSDLYLAGHSQGGLTAVLAAGLMSDVVKALMPLSPAMCIPYDASRGNMLGGVFDPDHLPEKFSSPTWELSANYIRAARMLPVDEAIKAYKGPVMVLHGTADEAVPYSFGKELSEKYQNAKLVSIEGDDHCYGKHMDLVLKAFKEFLQEPL